MAFNQQQQQNMESESVKFGGPRELGGALDLITQYKLLPHHEFFCKRSLPESLSDAHYLHNLVGDTEIRKGEGMQLDQLIPNASLSSRDTNARIQPFVLDELKEAFELNDTAPVELPPAEKGAPTTVSKSKSESKDKDRKHRKHKDKKEKDREHKKHKHKHKDRSKDKDKDKDRDKKKEKSGHHDKKRKNNGTEDADDVQRHKKSKHKSSKLDEMGAM